MNRKSVFNLAAVAAINLVGARISHASDQASDQPKPADESRPDPISIFVNETAAGKGIVLNGVAYVPAQLIADQFGGSSIYNARDKAVEIDSPAAKGHAGASVPPAEPPSDTPNAGSSWSFVDSFDGETTKKTDTFTITSKKWRITWTFDIGSEDTGIFSITVYGAKDDSEVDLVANTTKSGGDTSYMHKAGEFYLDISAIGKYTIRVEESR